ncbi:uncharacterized protein LOC127854101 [Dreissena polymorpha]|uniref:Uncharacterized protein n=1 Tax=Dreissena polymorpha TaxID=45954 RepID=A0A9D4CIR9_DREPO|nr:uncharacterized protein LOC127854101 [Dreissena polymorpha]KAH3725257.1 hypothetical protein DPMN_051092 [Dreissena polymorpha]
MFISLVILGTFWTESFGLLLDGNGPRPSSQNQQTVGALEETGWRMIFRATSGNGADVYQAWTNGVNITTQKPTTMDRSYDPHFRDRDVERWDQQNIRYVKFSLFKQSEEVGYVVFDGTGSTYMSWFDRSRVEASSWSDLTSANTYNFFSIQGHIDGQNLERTFFINQVYNGCDADVGNVVVVEHDGGCNWDHQPRYPQFLYSDMNAADNWNRRMFGRADYLAIFIYAKH